MQRDDGNAEGPPSRITTAEVFEHDPIIGWLVGHVGVATRQQRVTLGLMILVPFVAFIGVTGGENRLELGSMNWAYGKTEGLEAVGMSFLGDTMVWPFFFLVPAALLLLKYASYRLTAFLDGVPGLFDKNYLALNPRAPNDVIISVRASLNANSWKGVWRFALVVAMIFVAYNAFVCTFPDTRLPLLGRAYGTNVLHLVNGDMSGDVTLTEAVLIRKWDTDYAGAPWSWLLARVWTVFGYGLLPLALASAIRVVVALTAATSALGDTDGLRFRPLAADQIAGYSDLSKAALAASYLSLPFTLMAFAALFKEGIHASIHNSWLMLMMVPICGLTFLLPVHSVHSAIKRAKERYLETLSSRFDGAHARMMEHLDANSATKAQLEEVGQALGLIREHYDHGRKTPEWPVELGIALRFMMTSLAPFAMFVFKEFIKPGN